MRQPKVPPRWTDSFNEFPAISDLMKKVSRPEVIKFTQKANRDYMHWDKLRRYEMPGGIEPVEMWAAIEMSRQPQFREVGISIARDDYFRYWTPPQHQEWLHRIDQDAGGSIGSRSRVIDDGKERFLIGSLMEEAIASSQLEGASTTRLVAKQMLRSGRRPRDTHEQMIVNNYNAILEIRECKNENLTPELLCAFQRIITEKTLAKPDQAGRFRNASDDEVCVADAMTDEIIYMPPNHHSIGWRIEELCDFANEKSEPFIHPVIKAIILHFAIGYIHPFADGNGRTARALFYWYMLKSKYWVFEYLPISRIVLDAPIKYARAYLYTESDRGDLTYFIHYHLRVIERAVREMNEYFVQQAAFLHEASNLINNMDLNHRQLAAATYAIQHPYLAITFREHARVNDIALNTARNDILGLEKSGVLVRRKSSRTLAFVVAPEFRGKAKTSVFRAVPRKKRAKLVPVTKPLAEAHPPMDALPKVSDPQLSLFDEPA